jgi:YegS/Rv2252/BmrU family lipid kinase
MANESVNSNRNFLFLLNPISGGGKTASLPEIIRQQLQPLSIPYYIQHTPKDNDYSDILHVIKKDQITDVIICGGDGTINAVINHLRDDKLRFGIIPSGSGNGLALAAGISLNIKKALKVILRGKTIDADAIDINGRLSCMVFGTGFDAHVSHEFNRSKRRGFFLYAWLTLKNLFSMKSFFVDIVTNGDIMPMKVVMICAATGNQFGNRFTIAPKASLDDGLMDLIIVKKMTVMAFITRVLYHLKWGRPSASFNKDRSVIYWQGSSIRIYNPYFAPAHFDGDTCETSPEWDMEVVKGAYKLIVP